MLRVDALAHTAQVVNLQPFGNRTLGLDVRVPMRPLNYSEPVERPIAAIGLTATPQPAGRCFLDLRPKPFIEFGIRARFLASRVPLRLAVDFFGRAVDVHLLMPRMFACIVLK